MAYGTLLTTTCYVIMMPNCYAENDYFDQRLVWAAPKRWSKYTTPNAVIKSLFYLKS